MNKEILMSDFKEIPNFDGRYIISIDGIIYDTLDKKFLEQKKRTGVKNPKKNMVCLSKGGSSSNTSVESLLFKIFNVDVVFNIKDFNGEVWVDIIGYEGEYQVSNYGRVKSLPRIIIQNGRERIMYGNLMSTKRNNGSGYINILLSKGEDGYETKYIHRLVAQHFVKNYSWDMTINHKDFNKANNHVYNLECITQKENNIHYKDNEESHFITDDLKLQVSIMYAQEMSIDEMCDELNLQYPVVKQIINKYVTI
jgi:hypothetical protein